MSEEEKIISDMLHIILKYSDDFDELEENEIRYQLPYKQMEKLYNYISNLQDQLQQKENIIKEVREYIEEWQRFPHTNGSTHKELKNLIDILDKENKNEEIRNYRK